MLEFDLQDNFQHKQLTNKDPMELEVQQNDEENQEEKVTEVLNIFKEFSLFDDGLLGFVV